MDSHRPICGRRSARAVLKESGYGREGSTHGLDDYLHTKYICQGQLD
jgi:acyl-CoA reductase-like NAD-dependent aldehyde dehydrogenase